MDFSCTADSLVSAGKTPARRPEAVLMMSWGFDGWIWMAVWIAALLVMVWLVVRGPSHPVETDAMQILRARFARGEISKAEFEQARTVLLDK
jgi:putative membrane protein